jgi:hypothetical protein
VLALICPDPPDLDPLLHALRTSLIAAAAFIALQILFRARMQQMFAAVWKRVLLLSRRPVLCGIFLFFLVIGARIALLPRLAVPVPGIHDEFSYLLMADTFAHGKLSNPPHPMWLSFETFHVNWFPRYASMYPPAQGVVLAVGQLLGHPWIGVLLSCAAMCCAIYWMLLAWLPSRWALVGGLLTWLKFCVVSYWINSYWGGAVAATGGALLLGALARILRRASWRDAAIFAFGLSILANSRPYEGLFFALPSLFLLARWFVTRSKKFSSRERCRSVGVPLAAILVITAAFMIFYNVRLTGHALLFPNALNVRTYHTAPMFLFEASKPQKQYNNQQFEEFYNGWEREEYDHTWESIECLTWLKTVRLFSAFAWWGALLALPGLFFVLRERRTFLFLITAALVALAKFLIVWSNAHYAAPLTCVVLALYLQSLRYLRQMTWRTFRWGAILARTSILLLLVDTASAALHKQCDTFYWTCQGDISRQTIQDHLQSMPGKHVVMVRYGEDHNIHDDWVYNRADIDRSKVAWAREISPEQDAKLFNYYKDRKIWLVTPDADNTFLAPYTPPTDDSDSGK